MNRRLFVRTLSTAAFGTIVPPGANAQDNRSPRPRQSLRNGRVVTIAADPAAISIDTARTAILVVDMQNDFGSEGGSFQRVGIDISMIRAAIPPTVRALGAARASGIKIIYLKMAFRPDLSDAGAPDSPNYLRHRQLLGLGQ